MADQGVSRSDLDPPEIAGETLDVAVVPQKVLDQRLETRRLRLAELRRDLFEQLVLAPCEPVLDVVFEAECRLAGRVDAAPPQCAEHDLDPPRRHEHEAVAGGDLQKADEAQRCGGVHAGDTVQVDEHEADACLLLRRQRIEDLLP